MDFLSPCVVVSMLFLLLPYPLFYALKTFEKGSPLEYIVDDPLNCIMMKVVSEFDVLAKTLGFLDWFFPNGALNQDEE